MLDRTIDLRKVWTEEMDDKLRALVGTSSFRDIAPILGVTRNAAIGRAGRIGLSNKKPKLTAEQKFVRDAERELRRLRNNDRRNERRRERRANGEYAPISYVPVISNIPKPESLNVTFAEIERHQCRWIEGEAVPTLFCGATTKDSSSYCPHHHQIVWHPAPEKFRARAHS